MSRIMRLAIGTAVVATGLFVAPVAASAIPTGCSTYYINGQYNSPVGAYSVCQQGSGFHRIEIRCRNANGQTYDPGDGPWKPAGQRSEIYCNPGDVAYNKQLFVTG